MRTSTSLMMQLPRSNPRTCEVALSTTILCYPFLLIIKKEIKSACLMFPHVYHLQVGVYNQDKVMWWWCVLDNIFIPCVVSCVIRCCHLWLWLSNSCQWHGKLHVIRKEYKGNCTDCFHGMFSIRFSSWRIKCWQSLIIPLRASHLYYDTIHNWHIWLLNNHMKRNKR